MLWFPLLAACAPDLTPSWVFDPLWTQQDGIDGLYGFQTWEVFGPKWDRKHSDRHYVCAVVVELVGEATDCDAEPECTHAWTLESTLVESDCDPTMVQDPLFVSLERVALGAPATGEVPYPGETATGWADYGNGWEVHGEAYPDALDHGETAVGTFDDGEPYSWLPTQAFTWPP
jgi:hypothetical protein